MIKIQDELVAFEHNLPVYRYYFFAEACVLGQMERVRKSFIVGRIRIEAEFWPKLTKVKNQYIQIDWGKWVD